MRALARRDVTTRGKRETLPLLHAAPRVSGSSSLLTEIVPKRYTGLFDLNRAPTPPKRVSSDGFPRARSIARARPGR